jgi:uncharacterized membrane protein HdeD (DUF308 family)
MNRPLNERDWNDRDRGFAIDTEALARYWWALVLRGVAGIIFGVLAFVMPALTLAALVMLFGAYALVDGIFAIVAAASGRAGGRWWALLLAGVLGVAAGLVTFFMPGLTALTLAILIGAWAIAEGILHIITAIRLRKVIENEWWLGLSGALAIVFGVFMLRAPAAGALAVVLWIGAFAFIYGVILVALGITLRVRRDDVRSVPMRRAA